MRKLKVILIGSSLSTLPQNVQTTITAGLAVVFDGLNDIPGGIAPEVIADLQAALGSYHPGNTTSFQQWLVDSNALLQAAAADTSNAVVEKDANWVGQIVMLIAGGKTEFGAIFASLFKKHSVAPVVATPAK